MGVIQVEYYIRSYMARETRLHVREYGGCWTAPGMLPFLVVIYGFSHTREHEKHAGPLFTDGGLFVVAPNMRGHDGSAGREDCGHMEIHEIYDAVQAYLDPFRDCTDPAELNLWGCSGGGSTAFSYGASSEATIARKSKALSSSIKAL